MGYAGWKTNISPKEGSALKSRALLLESYPCGLACRLPPDSTTGPTSSPPQSISKSSVKTATAL